MILGEIFAIQYPIKYNYNHNTVGFAINTNAVEGVTITSKLNGLDVSLIIGGSVLGIIIAIACCLKCAQKEQKDQ